MDRAIRQARGFRTLAAGIVGCTAAVLGIATGTWAQTDASHAEPRLWPCRLVVKPTLLGAMENAWPRSATLRHQCEVLAQARAVVMLEWGKTDSQSRALSQIRLDKDGVVVAVVSVPPVSDAAALVGHELQHVIETIQGLDFAAESKKPGSGVWRAFGGFETQAAIDAGVQIAKELRENKKRIPIRD